MSLFEYSPGQRLYSRCSLSLLKNNDSICRAFSVFGFRFYIGELSIWFSVPYTRHQAFMVSRLWCSSSFKVFWLIHQELDSADSSRRVPRRYHDIKHPLRGLLYLTTSLRVSREYPRWEPSYWLTHEQVNKGRLKRLNGTEKNRFDWCLRGHSVWSSILWVLMLVFSWR